MDVPIRPTASAAPPEPAGAASPKPQQQVDQAQPDTFVESNAAVYRSYSSAGAPVLVDANGRARLEIRSLNADAFDVTSLYHAVSQGTAATAAHGTAPDAGCLMQGCTTNHCLGNACAQLGCADNQCGSNQCFEQLCASNNVCYANSCWEQNCGSYYNSCTSNWCTADFSCQNLIIGPL